MSVIEAGGRGGAIALLLLLAALSLRDGWRLPAARYAALFALGVAATLVVFAPTLATTRSLWLAPLRVLAFGNPAVFLVVTLALFNDEFALDWRYIGVWLALVALGFWAVYFDAGSRPFLMLNGLSLACLALAVWPVLAGRAGDLVESRRRLRVVFVVSVAAFIAAVIATVTLLHGGLGHPAYGYANAFGALAMTAFFAMALLSLKPGALFEPPFFTRTGGVAPGRDAASAAPADPREPALLAALNREMAENRAYRDETLNIAGLARRLGVPEYRLRRLINQRLGHRNFSAFLNSYRLDEVMAWLADPSQAEAAILTLALDAGFTSIGPFNRAFKARTGMTPSEFRQQPPRPA
jgi:AraC-like DNA-binding protein